MSVAVKICGLDRADSVDAAVQNGAAYVGFVFYPPSPRNLSPEAAAPLIARVPENVSRVGLFVDPTDDLINAVLALSSLDLVQLHGSETPARVTEIKQLTNLSIMKVIKLAGPEDLASAAAYYDVADRLLFDAKAPADMKNALPGGNALAFDWELLRDADIPLPWMLAGGLDAENLAEAVSISGASELDVSSGVESAPGIKDLKLIKDFLSAAKG
ncbi:MAG: phosphoribosylanthranilate isomerase [Rhodospirillaceae bacterium]|jgi:phosphoribosylanthranilate isomerase|nr:phosphoribosylanthranilate isomerase [Rhodospirillaceae bacterium]MBT4588820.1 phosphoribosylanthranilate isomerase [Rhodospirillaceae bacterium]MBT4941129.1 phosphoribosylanthranilate isomerase [Rhodospirillaceae bacterium]MBT7266770.1 phosphoribosylanthranilate isomerase [Rhodospirillaceae bacterium]